MAKIPFTLEAWLKDKSQNVETRDGRPARIICTDAKADDGACIVALIPGYGGEEAYQFFSDGRAFSSKSSDEYCADLFLVTPEPELSEWELAIAKYRPPTDSKETIQRIAAELLSLAREQLIKDGYVIEKKAFHDAVENISDKHLTEMSVEYSLHCKVEDGTRHAIMNWDTFQKVAQKFIDIGRAEALKDLPRWKKIGENGRNYSDSTQFVINGRYLEMNDTLNDVYEIALSDLAKLPKEDSNE